MRDGDIRVKTDAKYKDLYKDMKEHGAITDSHELFFVCACMGFARGQRKPLERPDERFWSNTISATEWSCYYAMMMHLNEFDLSVLVDDKEVMAVMQEYSNAGLELLIEDLLGSYMLRRTDVGEPQLDPSCAKTLPKDFLYYILEQSGANSWEAFQERYS